MMLSHGKKMDSQVRMRDSGSTSKSGPDRAGADTSGHAEHHPEN
jgi:hypothetical protein